jgi:flagellar L-ring protein precursor FlgH
MRGTFAHSVVVALAAWAMSAPLAAATLWQAETLADGTLYSDQVARKKGDLITIDVNENTSVSDLNQTETERQNDISSTVSLLPGSNKVAATVGSSASTALPGLVANSDKHYQGKGNYTASNQVIAAITARVVDVLDNGNLVIEGRRSVKVNNDIKTILITGIVRTADIKSDNTVLSEKLHDFQVSIDGDGPLTRAQEEGWMGRILDVLWPF